MIAEVEEFQSSVEAWVDQNEKTKLDDEIRISRSRLMSDFSDHTISSNYDCPGYGYDIQSPRLQSVPNFGGNLAFEPSEQKHTGKRRVSQSSVRVALEALAAAPPKLVKEVSPQTLKFKS